VAKQQKQHDPAKSKAAESQAAALPPSNDIGSKAAGKQVGQMDQQQPKAFDRKAFKAALLTKIAATAPKNLKEADEFKESGKVGTIKGELTGQVVNNNRAVRSRIKSKAHPIPAAFPPKPLQAYPLIRLEHRPVPLAQSWPFPNRKRRQRCRCKRGVSLWISKWQRRMSLKIN
jgi:hypothetical protein